MGKKVNCFKSLGIPSTVLLPSKMNTVFLNTKLPIHIKSQQYYCICYEDIHF